MSEREVKDEKTGNEDNKPEVTGSALLMLEELRLEMNRELDRRKIIENKASNLITLCSSIVAFLFAFTAFTSGYQGIANDSIISSLVILSLIIPSIILILLSLLSSLLAIMLARNFPTAFVLDSIVYRDGTVIEPALEGFRKETLGNLTSIFHHRYTNALVLHDKFNDKKFKRTLMAQKLLLGGISLLSAALILTYVNFLR